MHYAVKSSSTTGLRIVEVFFVGAAAIVTDIFVPAAAEHLLLEGFLLARVFTRLSAVALFVSASPGVFVDQDSFDQSHGSDQSSECVGVKKLALVGKCMSDKLVVLDVIFDAETDASRFGCLG